MTELFKQTLTKGKSTKNKHVYVNDDADVPVSSLYIDKTAFKDKEPDAIVITVALNAS